MKAIAVFLVVLFSGIMGAFVSDTAQAESGYSWTAGQASVLQRSYQSGSFTNTCMGYQQDLMVSELQMLQKVCVYGDDRLKIGHIGSAGSLRAVVGFPYDTEIHILEGICSGLACRYSADQDMIVSQTPTSAFGWSVVVYKHVSERIKQTRLVGGEIRYSFDSSQPEYVAKDLSGGYLWTPSYAISRNGKWIVMEVQEKGMVVVNTDTFEARQITSSGALYGRGFDPEQQLAVSNNGKSVAVMGLNMGFGIFDSTERCGRPLGNTISEPGMIECPETDVGVSVLFPGFRSAFHPRFYGEGQQLQATINSWTEPRTTITFLANGSKPVHSLKLLALGDSFTSGEGETDKHFYQVGTDDEFDTCHTSRRSYPLLVAASLAIGPTDAKSVACSGARIKDIIGVKETYWGQGSRLGSMGLSLADMTQAQVDSLESFQPGRSLQASFLEQYNPEKLIIGIGGNDAGLMGKLRVCAMPGTCEWAKREGMRATADEIKRLGTSLGGLFAYILDSHPGTTVYVSGYPQIIEVNGLCDPVTDTLFDYDERKFIENSINYLNQVTRVAAKKAGFTYLDIEHSFDNKRLCSESGDSAMNGLRIGNDIAPLALLPLLKMIGAETFHPNPLGHRRIADDILLKRPALEVDDNCSVSPTGCSEAELNSEAPDYWGATSEDNNVFTVGDFVISKTSSSNLSIMLADGSLRPNSSVDVEIRSTPTVLRTIQTNERGGIQASVSLPDDISSGYHSIHLLGLNVDDKRVNIYQFIAIGEDGEVVSEGSSEIDTAISLKDTSGSSSSSLASELIAEVMGVQDAFLGKSVIRDKIVAPLRTTTKVLKGNNWWPYVVISISIVGLGLLAGIIWRRKWVNSSS